MNDLFCAQASLGAGEGLFGSAAADTDVWLLLEYDKSWEAEPLPGTDLPTEVKERISSWLDRVPRSRLQLIRRPGAGRAGPFALYIARSLEQPWMVRFELERYEDVLSIDLEATLRSGSAEGARHVDRLLHLVCTHGKRDRCCAKWGQPIYQAFADRDPDGAWQTTHLGGHRFAANVLVLPHGVSYGRVEVGEVPAMLEAHERGELYDLERLRGRTCYAAPTQAAEYYVRRETGFGALGGLRHVDTFELTDGRWRVQFEVPGDRIREIDLIQESAGQRPKSCGAEPTAASRFRRAS